MYVITCLTIDCNNFFLKFVLWVPPEHDLLKYRVALWGLAAIPTSKEWYEFISNEHCHRLGPFGWCMLLGASVETMIVYKFGRTEFTEPFPLYVKIIWSIIGTIYTYLFITAWRNQISNSKLSEKKAAYNPYNPQISIKQH